MPKSRSTKSKVGGGKSQPGTEEALAGMPSSVWSNGGTIFMNIHAKPGAKQSCITEISDTHIVVQIAAPAQKGEANMELIRTIAKTVGVRKSAVSIDEGQRSREKRVRISDTDKDVAEIMRLLQSSVGQSQA